MFLQRTSTTIPAWKTETVSYGSGMRKHALVFRLLMMNKRNGQEINLVWVEKAHAYLDTTALSIGNFMHSPLKINVKKINQFLSSNRINTFNCSEKMKNNLVSTYFHHLFSTISCNRHWKGNLQSEILIQYTTFRKDLQT